MVTFIFQVPLSNHRHGAPVYLRQVITIRIMLQHIHHRSLCFIIHQLFIFFKVFLYLVKISSISGYNSAPRQRGPNCNGHHPHFQFALGKAGDTSARFTRILLPPCPRVPRDTCHVRQDIPIDHGRRINLVFRAQLGICHRITL